MATFPIARLYYSPPPSSSFSSSSPFPSALSSTRLGIGAEMFFQRLYVDI